MPRRPLAAALVLLALPLAAPAQTVIEDTPGPYEVLAFDAWITEDAAPLLDVVRAEYEGRFTEYPDREAIIMARRAGGAQIALFEGERRTIVNITGTPLTPALLTALAEYFPQFDPAMMASFDEGLSLSAVTGEEEDSPTAVTMALLGDKGARLPAPPPGAPLPVAEGIALPLPLGAEILTETDLPGMRMTMVEVPGTIEGTEARMRDALAAAGLNVQQGPPVEDGTRNLMVLMSPGLITVSVSPSGNPGTVLLQTTAIGQ